MRISASIQAANQLNLLSHIDSNNEKFDQLHIDITDGHFAENISMSFKVIEMLKNNTDYFLDIHLMIYDNLKYGKIAFDCGADLVTVHKESTELSDFIKLSEFNNNIQKENIKNKLKELTNEAFKKDIFGAPTFVVENKIFWGQDRLEYALDEYNS